MPTSPVRAYADVVPRACHRVSHVGQCDISYFL